MGAPEKRPCLELGLNRPERSVGVCKKREIARGCEEEGRHTTGKKGGDESRKSRSDVVKSQIRLRSVLYLGTAPKRGQGLARKTVRTKLCF